MKQAVLFSAERSVRTTTARRFLHRRASPQQCQSSLHGARGFTWNNARSSQAILAHSTSIQRSNANGTVSRETRFLYPFRTRSGGRDSFCLGPQGVVLTFDVGYSSSSDVPGASAPTMRARSSSPANSIVMRPFFAPRVTLTRVSKASESRVERAGRGVLRARSTRG